MDQSRRSVLLGAAGVALLGLGVGPTLAQVQAPRATVGGSSTTASTPSAIPEYFSAVSADGTLLAGQAQGDPAAPEILFIHGLRQSRLSWEKQFADAALAGLRQVAFDLRGHGDSSKPACLEAYSEADRWADDVAAVIAAAKLRRPVLVGWSLGGYAVGAYLRKYGGSAITGINLVDALTKFSSDLLTTETVTFSKSTTSHDLATRTAATVEFLAACFHQQPSADEMQRMLVVNGMTAREVNEGFLRSQTTDFDAAFKAFNGPILLTHGVHDRLVRVAMSERIKALHANSEISLYRGSGHAPFFEEPVRFGRELSEFVELANRG